MMIFLASLCIVHNQADTLGTRYDTILNPFLIFLNSDEIFYVLVDKFTLIRMF
jgi:hypothetical protein